MRKPQSGRASMQVVLIVSFSGNTEFPEGGDHVAGAVGIYAYTEIVPRTLQYERSALSPLRPPRLRA